MRSTSSFILILSATLAQLFAESRAESPLVDAEYLTAEIWNDGQAEIAFYQVEGDYNQYGRPGPQSFLMGTYLVKHEFDRDRLSKANAESESVVSSFKWAAFYEFESDNSYQYKRAYVVNAAQSDLTPLKQSFTSFDWCSNQYRELSFSKDGRAEYLMRSDDYGNARESFDVPDTAYPVAEVPLLVRALDFTDSPTRTFSLLLEDGTTVSVQATREGRETKDTADGPLETERIHLRYDGDFRSIVSRRAEREETYWRTADGDRVLVAMESASYRMKLVERVRSSYWRENVYSKLRHVTTRP